MKIIAPFHLNAVRNLPAMFKESRIEWNSGVCDKGKLNLMQDRNCISSLLKVKVGNLKHNEWTFSDNVEWMKWVGALEVTSKMRLKGKEGRKSFYLCSEVISIIFLLLEC